MDLSRSESQWSESWKFELHVQLDVVLPFIAFGLHLKLQGHIGYIATEHSFCSVDSAIIDLSSAKGTCICERKKRVIEAALAVQIEIEEEPDCILGKTVNLWM